MLNIGDGVWIRTFNTERGVELVEAVAVARESVPFRPAHEYDDLLRRKIPIDILHEDLRGCAWCLASDEEEVAAFKVAHALR